MGLRLNIRNWSYLKTDQQDYLKVIKVTHKQDYDDDYSPLNQDYRL